MIQNGFSIIGLPIEFSTKLPFTISKNLQIDRPSDRQLKVIKDYFDNLGSTYDFSRPFENKNFVNNEDDISIPGINAFFVDSTPLDKNDWLYSVVKFKTESKGLVENPSQEVFDLCLAGLICDKEFVILYNFFTKLKYGWGNNTEAYDHLEQICLDDKIYSWDKSDLLKLKMLYAKVINARNDFPDIYHSLNLYHALPKLVGYNELICLGLFTIIESVLTHNPKSTVDSIGHQIKTKIRLLSNRFDNEIDYSTFKNIPIDTLWKKLYDFRSRIAHGGKIDFTKEFKILTSSFTVQEFLSKFLKTLLRNALSEPQLYIDLKEC